MINAISAFSKKLAHSKREKIKNCLQAIIDSHSGKKTSSLRNESINKLLGGSFKKQLSDYNDFSRKTRSEAGTSRINFNRNKSTMNRRRVPSGSFRNDSVMDNTSEDSSYAAKQIPEITRTKRVSSVLKTYPKKIKL